MKSLLIIVLIGVGIVLGWNKIQAALASGPEPLYNTSYFLVYGRDTCGITRRMRQELDRAGVPYEYKSVDAPGVADELHPRMAAAGLDPRRYGLPVVDVNAELMIRPKGQMVAEKYRQFDAVGKADRSEPAATESSSPSAATRHLADPIVRCTIQGRESFMLRSQCPDSTSS